MFKDKDYSQILNTHSYMKGKVMDWVENFIVNEDIKDMGWKTFKKHLNEAFVNVNDARNVRVKVLNYCFDLCYQTIQEAFVQFEGWIQQAGSLTLGYDGGILIQAIEKNMPPSLVENLLEQLAYSDTDYHTQKKLALLRWLRIQRCDRQKSQPKAPAPSYSQREGRKRAD